MLITTYGPPCTPLVTNMTRENPPFEDVFRIENIFPMSC